MQGLAAVTQIILLLAVPCGVMQGPTVMSALLLVRANLAVLPLSHDTA